MISILQSGDKYEVRFPYDPHIVELVKQAPGRTWNPDGKFWTIPAARLGFLLAQFKGTQYEKQVVIQSNENINVNASIDGPNQIPNIDISEYQYRVQKGLYPYKHQIDSLKVAKWRYENGLRSGFILADQPGAAKTCQVMNIGLYMRQFHNMKHCLIIACVNSAKFNWIDDIVKHTDGEETPYLLGTRLTRKGTVRKQEATTQEKLDDLLSMTMYNDGSTPLPFFLVVNIEAIRMRVGKKYPFADRLIEMIHSGELGMIALDEVHRGCSMESIQGKQLLRVKKSTTEAMWIPMTGTPITSKPTDAFLPMRLVDAHQSNSYWQWCQEFCIYGGFGGHEIIGYRNIPKLKDMLQPNMLRRLKKDILDLPPKIHFTEYIENSPCQKRLYAKISGEVSGSKEKIKHSLNPLSEFLRLRQVNGSPELVDPSITLDKNYLSKNAKLARLLQLLDDILADPDEKVVIFSNWVEPLRTLYRFISQRYKICCYTGTMKPAVREKHKKVFLTNPNYRIMIGTVGALGTSHTLTVARNVIFYDSPWNPSDIEQCEDRCHRPGSTQSVNVYTLITRDTVDEKVHALLSKKEGTAKYIVDDTLDIRNHPEILDYLLE